MLSPYSYGMEMTTSLEAPPILHQSTQATLVGGVFRKRTLLLPSTIIKDETQQISQLKYVIFLLPSF